MTRRIPSDECPSGSTIDDVGTPDICLPLSCWPFHPETTILSMTDDAELLAIRFRTAFVFERSSRISTTNDPRRSPAPRFALSGCASGNVYGIRTDVSDSVAVDLISLAALEPPFVDQSGAPRHLDRYIELLSRDAVVPQLRLGVTYVLPNDIAYQHDVQLICSDSIEGQGLRATLAAEGVPTGLAELGFADVSEFWDPWCAALQHDGVAAVAFAARLAGAGADLGVATSPELRGRGYAAAATAGWARMAALRSRALFYSTDQTNISSRRVIARLGLRLLGASLELS
jgi:Acetyltransferase (GNAT) domain